MNLILWVKGFTLGQSSMTEIINVVVEMMTLNQLKKMYI